MFVEEHTRATRSGTHPHIRRTCTLMRAHVHGNNTPTWAQTQTKKTAKTKFCMRCRATPAAEHLPSCVHSVAISRSKPSSSYVQYSMLHLPPVPPPLALNPPTLPPLPGSLDVLPPNYACHIWALSRMLSRLPCPLRPRMAASARCVQEWQHRSCSCMYTSNIESVRRCQIACSRGSVQGSGV